MKMMSALVSLFMVLCLSLLLYATVFSDSKELFGYRIFIVKTNSMMDTLAPGDLIVTKKYPESKLKVRDVITFYSSDEEIKGMENTHRVVKIEAGEYYTQGDAADTVDRATVTYDRIIGKMVFSSRAIGRITVFISKPVNMLLFILLPIAAFTFFDIAAGIKKLIRLIKKMLSGPPDENPGTNEEAHTDADTDTDADKDEANESNDNPDN